MSRYCDFDHENKQIGPIHGYTNQSLLSLEKALDPVLRKIQRLDHYINVAKRHCCYPSDHGLTRDESAAVYLYSTEWGDVSISCMLNNVLRSNDPNTIKPWFTYLKLLSTGLLKLPLYSGNAWRGDIDHVSRHYKKGQKFIWWTITSCSLSLDVINELMGEKGTIFLMEVINGRNAGGYTRQQQEGEVILLPGTSVCVLNMHNTRIGMHIIQLKVLEEEHSQLRDNDSSSILSGSLNVQNHRPVRPAVTNDRHSPVRNTRNPSVQRDPRPSVPRDRNSSVQRDRKPSVQSDIKPSVPRDRKPSVQRNRRSPVQQDTPRRNRVDPPVPTRESREPLSCGGHACYSCQKCCDWKWNNQSNDWNRSSEATCRGIYTVDGNNHYVRGPGGGRGGGGIFPICECDM